MAFGTCVSKDDLLDSILLFGVMHDKPTFSARDCTLFLNSMAISLDEEKIDELMAELVEQKRLRQIGPGIYAQKKVGRKPVPLEHPLWPEDAGR